MKEATRSWPTRFVHDGRTDELDDPVVVEDPLGIEVVDESGASYPLGLVMRTPGADEELAAGLAWGEGVFDRPEDLLGVRRAPRPGYPQDQRVEVRVRRLAAELPLRHQIASSACGVCGRAALDAPGPTTPLDPAPIDAAILPGLPAALARHQDLFERTGSIHGAASCDADGRPAYVYEDVGRHNAVDKVVGAALLAGEPVGHRPLLTVSGRIGYEIVQKAARARFALLAAVGGPTSLSLQLAHRSGLTVVGFLRPGRYNIYTHPQRLAPDEHQDHG